MLILVLLTNLEIVSENPELWFNVFDVLENKYKNSQVFIVFLLYAFCP